jgi:hypothetical protein
MQVVVHQRPEALPAGEAALQDTQRITTCCCCDKVSAAPFGWMPFRLMLVIERVVTACHGTDADPMFLMSLHPMFCWR